MLILCLHIVCLDSASANTMATHGVDDLVPTSMEGRLGKGERYSLSFSCGVPVAWAGRGDAAATAEILRLLRKQPRFQCVTEILALHPAPTEVRIQ